MTWWPAPALVVVGPALAGAPADPAATSASGPSPPDTPAAALAPGCDPFDEAALRGTLDLADQRLADDLDAVDEAARTVVDRAPCLVFVPDPRDWARLLVSQATVAKARGGDWQAPLATAMRISPSVDRKRPGDPEIAAFTLPRGAAPHGDRLPDRQGDWYVDGRPATRLPGGSAQHLVQLMASDGLHSAIVTGGPVPDWTPPKPPAYSLALSGYGGVRATREQTASAEAIGLDPSYGGLVQAWVGRTAAASVRIAGPLDPAGELAVGVRATRVFVGGGAAVHRVTAATSGAERWAFAPIGSVHAWVPGKGGIDAAGGWTPAETLARLQVGAVAGHADTRLRVGVCLGWTESRWLAAEVDELRVATWSAAVTLGVGWGAW